MPATSEVYPAGECKSAEGGQATPEDPALFSLFCDERGYLNQIKYILQYGVSKGDRTGTGVVSVFGLQARYSLRGGLCSQNFPSVPLRHCLSQFLAFKILAEQQCLSPPNIPQSTSNPVFTFILNTVDSATSQTAYCGHVVHYSRVQKSIR